jgi:hypothetical protein
VTFSTHIFPTSVTLPSLHAWLFSIPVFESYFRLCCCLSSRQILRSSGLLPLFALTAQHSYQLSLRCITILLASYEELLESLIFTPIPSSIIIIIIHIIFFFNNSKSTNLVGHIKHSDYPPRPHYITNNLTSTFTPPPHVLSSQSQDLPSCVSSSSRSSPLAAASITPIPSTHAHGTVSRDTTPPCEKLRLATPVKTTLSAALNLETTTTTTPTPATPPGNTTQVTVGSRAITTTPYETD